MAMVKYQPSRSISPFSSAVNRVFDEFWPRMVGPSMETPAEITPSVDIIEHDDHVTLRADMPGMNKDDIKVVVSDGLLTIEGCREETSEDKRKGYVRAERHVGTVCRSFNLPTWADASKINANYKNGVLEVDIPKSEKTQPKQVEVKLG